MRAVFLLATAATAFQPKTTQKPTTKLQAKVGDALGAGRQRFCCCGARPSAGRGSSGRHAALRDDAKRDVGAALKDAQRDDGAVRSTPIRSDRASITRKFKTLLVSAERFPSTGRDVGVARRRRSSRGRSRDLPESPIPQSGTSARGGSPAAGPAGPAGLAFAPPVAPAPPVGPPPTPSPNAPWADGPTEETGATDGTKTSPR